MEVSSLERTASFLVISFSASLMRATDGAGVMVVAGAVALTAGPPVACSALSVGRTVGA